MPDVSDHAPQLLLVLSRLIVPSRCPPQLPKPQKCLFAVRARKVKAILLAHYACFWMIVKPACIVAAQGGGHETECRLADLSVRRCASVLHLRMLQHAVDATRLFIDNHLLTSDQPVLTTPSRRCCRCSWSARCPAMRCWRAATSSWSNSWACRSISARRTLRCAARQHLPERSG